MVGVDVVLRAQRDALAAVLHRNTTLYDVLQHAHGLQLPQYFVASGCIAQSVWNDQTGRPLMYGISDIDVVYFDPIDVSRDAEDAAQDRLRRVLSNAGVTIDVKNQARVHLWYHERFGYGIAPYTSVEQAIKSWPTTATAVGVRLEHDRLVVYAPFGLNDLFGMIIRPNKAQITAERYAQKCVKWKARWPELQILPW